MMNAELVAVGTELLMGQIANTNAQYLSQRMAEIGIAVYHHAVVGDNLERAQNVLHQAKHRGANVVILCGGLGPTEDDLTRQVVASTLGKPLILSDEIVEHIRSLYTYRGREMPENNKQQALVIEGATVLDNPRGTAPGQYIEADGVHYFLLPGPPAELKGMYQEKVLPILQRVQGEVKQVFASRYLHTFNIGESALELKILDIIQAQSNPTVAPYASEGGCTIRLTASAATEPEALALIAPVEAAIRERIGHYIYGVDDETLQVKPGKLLREKGQRMVTAESCTGGLIGQMVTDLPGSSEYFYGSVVAYDNTIKERVLGVDPAVLREHGAVSEQTAQQMAEGARKLMGVDWAVSVTGIAGPGGGTAEKPVGLVYIGIAGPDGTTVGEHRLFGDRTQVRLRAARTALHSLIQRIQNER
ncbi:competence/damage-inducible protein A [Tumebacillus permanentifrigoris]|uniref:Putative competence-damage inducible protein n=1 Tax=Tumebacillus permanentifrigoris TaxID=378543 RepID=A0A316DD89_9BACL|nr:competence/damage-inducible protein A [Tumebacillus permanentifrigoris]PWK15492.1 nicotinamide-nucleotide amidase [Tumebacillus permanentifrigoris]